MIFTNRPRVSLARFTFCWWRHNRLPMTSQWPGHCGAIMGIMISNSNLNIGFIYGDVRIRSCTNLFQLRSTNSRQIVWNIDMISLNHNGLWASVIGRNVQPFSDATDDPLAQPQTADKCLPFGVCKETVKESTNDCAWRFLKGLRMVARAFWKSEARRVVPWSETLHEP